MKDEELVWQWNVVLATAYHNRPMSHFALSELMFLSGFTGNKGKRKSFLSKEL